MPRESFTPDPDLLAQQQAAAAALETPATPEHRETPKFRTEISGESLASSAHSDRLEDAFLGDPKRLAAEAVALPKLKTDNPGEDRRLIGISNEREAKAAEALRQLEVFGLLDGISGKLTGTGFLASRLASGIIAEQLAKLPPAANAEASLVALIKAVSEANEVLKDYSRNRPDLQQHGGATYAVARVVNGPEGKPLVPYVYGGNTRVYHYRRATNELIEVSLDDTFVGDAVRAGENPAFPPLKRLVDFTKPTLTMEEYRKINDDQDMIGIGSTLVEHRHKRDKLTGADRTIGCSKNFYPHAGIIEAEPGDRIMLLTDGAHSHLPHAELTRLIADGADAAQLCFEAKGPDGYDDDCSAVIVDLQAA